MGIAKGIIAVFIVVSVITGQDITISGTVTDTGTTPISGAVVKLENIGLTTTTEADGKFTLSNVGNFFNNNYNQLRDNKLSASTGNDFLYLHLQERGQVEVVIYTLRGKAISIARKVMAKGTHRIAQPFRGNGVYLYRIKTHNSELIIKSPSISRASEQVLNSERMTYTGKAIHAKCCTPIDDVITVTKEGYLNYHVVVTNSDTANIEIKMMACADTVRDTDGNVYQAVRIGNQVWTVENLRTTKYNDGTEIPHVPIDTAWSNCTTPAYCFYGNTTNADSIKKYGALYNWHAVNTKKLAPVGWHVPDTAEWDILEIYLINNGYNWDGTITGNKIAKSLAAKTDWYASSNSGAIGNDLTKNNRSGFSALPGGSRSLGTFTNFGSIASWWSAEILSSGEWCPLLRYDYVNLNRDSTIYWNFGLSVRLLRD